MNQRAKKLLAVFGIGAATTVATWLLSWFVQYLCTLLVSDMKFSFTDHAINQLAAVTVLVVAALMGGWFISDALSGCLAFIFCILAGAGFIEGVGWVAAHTLPGTPVSDLPIQILYGVIVLIWSGGLYYIFSPEKNEEEVEEDSPVEA